MANGKRTNGNEAIKLYPVLNAIADRLAIISRDLGVLALRFAPSRPKKTERIHFLHALGFDNDEIAAILGTTPGTVSARVSERKSTKKKKSRG
jgi:CRP-like cAMP-binding protein